MKSAVKIARLEIDPGEGEGGFSGATVTHHMKATATHSGRSGMNMSYSEPQKHVFGKDEGHEMLAHIANHLGIEEAPEEEDLEETELK